VTLQEALALLGEPPASLQSRLGAELQGWQSPDREGMLSLETAQANLQKATEAQHDCGSDAVWWAFEGERAFWQAVVYLLESAQLVGLDNLPDIAPPDPKYRMVMDRAWAIEQFGEAVLAAAKGDKPTGPSEVPPSP
jgi:hypothetical protein